MTDKEKKYESKKVLQRSKNNRVLFGVIGGLGEYHGLSKQNIQIIRLAGVISIVFTAGTVLFVYLILCMVIPEPK